MPISSLMFLGRESITVSTSAVSLTVPSGAQVAAIQVLSQPIRYSGDGNNPTASTRFRADPNDVLRITGADSLSKFRAIREGSSDATLEVHYYQ